MAILRIIWTASNNGNWATHVLQNPVQCLAALEKEGSVVVLILTGPWLSALQQLLSPADNRASGPAGRFTVRYVGQGGRRLSCDYSISLTPGCHGLGVWAGFALTFPGF